MAAKPLPNYLRMYRRKIHLTQDEIAFLIGGRDGSRLSRYEHFKRVPTLQTALALEAALGIPVKDLFAGEYVKVQTTVKRRAKVLAFRVNGESPELRRERRLDHLSRLNTSDNA